MHSNLKRRSFILGAVSAVSVPFTATADHDAFKLFMPDQIWLDIKKDFIEPSNLQYKITNTTLCGEDSNIYRLTYQTDAYAKKQNMHSVTRKQAIEFLETKPQGAAILYADNSTHIESVYSFRNGKVWTAAPTRDIYGNNRFHNHACTL